MKPIFVALDTKDVHKAAAIARDIRGLVGGVKLGLEFFCANGEEGVLRIAEGGLPIFLDLKLHDIPNTVGKAVEAIAHLQPAILTVHASGGRAMMAAAKAAAPAGTKVVAVTMLTSLDESDLVELGIQQADRVNRWNYVTGLAKVAREAGLDGIVCSGDEVGGVRDLWPDAYLVVPGVRPAGNDVADQKRVVTPQEALDRGASVLVIGRPITGATDPARAIREIEATFSQSKEDARI